MEKKKLNAYSWAGFSLVIFAAIYLGLNFLANIVVEMAGLSDKEFFQSKTFSFLTVYVPMYCIAVPVTLALLKRIPSANKEKTKFGKGNTAVAFFSVFAMMFVGSIIGNVLSYVVSGGKASNPLNSVISETDFLTVLVVVILAPIFEELIFRKTLIDKLEVYGEKNAVIFSALCFGLFHMNLYQIFYAFGIGLVFGYVYVKTHDIRYSVIFHMIVNFLGSVVAVNLLANLDLEKIKLLSQPGALTADEMAAIMPGLIAFFIYMVVYYGIVITGIVLFCIFCRKTEYVTAENELPKKGRFKTMYINVGFVIFFIVCIAMTARTLIVSM